MLAADSSGISRLGWLGDADQGATGGTALMLVVEQDPERKRASWGAEENRFRVEQNGTETEQTRPEQNTRQTLPANLPPTVPTVVILLLSHLKRISGVCPGLTSRSEFASFPETAASGHVDQHAGAILRRRH